MAALATADVNNQILTSVANFQTLLSLRLTSKRFNTVFKAHPNTIIRDVAYNEVGAALPQALRLVRCEIAHFRYATVGELPEETDVMTDPIEPQEAHMLAKNAKIAHTLEALFSWRCKDRTSRVSKLTNDESLRFQSALYRLWVYSVVYGMQPRSNDEEDNDDNDVADNGILDIQTIRPRRQSFLDSFTMPHLDEMEQVASFLKDIATWVIRANWRDAHIIDGFGDLALYNGPRAVLESYQGITSDPVEAHSWLWQDDEANDFFSSPLDLIRQERDECSQQSNGHGGHNVLHEVIGEKDMCQGCDAVKGLQLWNETNWDYLLGVLNSTIFQYLPGKLPLNFSEIMPLRDKLKEIGYSQFMELLFSEKEAPFDDLNKQDWLCLDCLGEILHHHLWQWWIDCKRSAGTVIPRNCWYGYNCRTMTHNAVHATKLNHLCVPTRGDP